MSTRSGVYYQSIEQRAELLGVSVSWLYGQVRAGRYPHERHGGRILIPIDEADTFDRATRVTADDALAAVDRQDESRG